jgi:hypothetical protein
MERQSRDRLVYGVVLEEVNVKKPRMEIGPPGWGEVDRVTGMALNDVVQRTRFEPCDVHPV